MEKSHTAVSIPKTLGVDFGTRRIGLAVSYGLLAEPLEIVPNDQQTLNKILHICRQQAIKQIVIGLSEQTMARLTKEFATLLEQHLNLPVVFFDETLSSQRVESKLRESGASLQKRQQPIDHLAATEILQEWLDTQ